MKKIKILFLLFSLCMTTTVYGFTSRIYSDNTWADFAMGRDFENKKDIEVHIKNQHDLLNYLIATGNNLSGDMVWFENDEDIYFPSGSYLFEKRTEFYFTEAEGNIDFQDSQFLVGSGGKLSAVVIGNQHNRYFENLVVYGNASSTFIDTDDSYTLTRDGSGFYMELVGASNMKFFNLDFNNSLPYGTHIFDVMGCNNITFEQIINRGAADNWTQDQMAKIMNAGNSHSIYAEMIQIDVLDMSSAGITSFLSDDFQHIFDELNLLTSQSASKNISVQEVRSTSYKGYSGAFIIDGSFNKVIKNYSASIGAHSLFNDPYQVIKINHNYFENVIYPEGFTAKQLAPIHFPTVSKPTRDLIYSGSSGSSTSDLVMGDEVWQNIDINTDNNEYIMCAVPTDFRAADICLGQKCNDSTYLVNTNRVKQEVNTVRLVDEEDNILKTYSSYVPEELVYDGDYIFKDSSYDEGTHTLTRVYRKPYIKTYSYYIPVDSDGNLLYVLDDYTLDHSEDGPSSTEVFANGDSITVKYTYRVYVQNNPSTTGDDPINPPSTGDNPTNPPSSGGDNPSTGENPVTNPSSGEPSSPSGNNSPTTTVATEIPDTVAHTNSLTYIFGIVLFMSGLFVFYQVGLFDYFKKE